jgi:hypothetical protein
MVASTENQVGSKHRSFVRVGDLNSLCLQIRLPVIKSELQVINLT